jgi:Cu(I)/Ag(I) efflux system membrane fusion protein
MASLKIKYAAMIVSSLIAGGLISVTAWQALHSSEKTENSVLKERSFSGMTR